MSAWKAALSGAWRFALVSLGGFGVWAGERYILPKGVGEVGLYIGCLVVFIALAELLLVPLVIGEDRRRRFNRAFIPAFIAYAVVWSVCWFALKSQEGEWLGSIAGCAVFAWIVGKRLGATSGFLSAIAILILCHSAGYFLGGKVFSMVRNPPALFEGWPRQDILTVAKFAWGLFYGLGFGAGIGYVFHIFQQPKKTS